MKLKQKLGVAAVFALGVFVIISSSECLPSIPFTDSAVLTPA
jgi:hypothetical protein